MFPSRLFLELQGWSSSNYPLGNNLIAFLCDLLSLRISLLSLCKCNLKFKILAIVFQKYSAAWGLSVGFCVSPSSWAITFVPVLSHANLSSSSQFPTNTNLNDQRLSQATKQTFNHTVVLFLQWARLLCLWMVLQTPLVLHVPLVVLLCEGRRPRGEQTSGHFVLTCFSVQSTSWMLHKQKIQKWTELPNKKNADSTFLSHFTLP